MAYTMRVTATVYGDGDDPDDCDTPMFEQVMTWSDLDYADLMKLERAIGTGLLENTLALGDALVAKMTTSKKD